MFERDTAATQRTIWRYVLELGFGMALWAGIGIARRPYLATMQDGPLRDAVALAPIVGTLIAIAAVVRVARRFDEYLQHRLLVILIGASAVTVLLSVAYAMLEMAGWPRLS